MKLIKLILTNIRRFRESNNISQEYVANELNITQSAYAKLENNQNKITLEKLFLIIEILEIDIIQLFYDNGQIPTKLCHNNLVDYINNLQNQNQQLLKDLVQVKKKYIELLETQK